MLGDLDYKLCETALMELFATHTYPPQISEIREKCAEYTVPHLKDQGEAWGEVQKAISQYGYYRQEEALESLTPIVREAVKRLGFREICLDENQDAVRAHFFKIYSALAERKSNDAKLPPGILEAKNKYIAQITAQENTAIEQKQQEEAEEDRVCATPEYIDMLMREHGFKTAHDAICAANKTQVFRSDWTPRDADADMFVKMVKRLARGFGFKLCDRIRFEDPATGKKYV